MAKITWSNSAIENHLAYADALLEEFGRDAMMDYLNLVEDALEQVSRYPEASSPTISFITGRRVQLTSRKQYQIHYEYDKASNRVIIIAVFK